MIDQSSSEFPERSPESQPANSTDVGSERSRYRFNILQLLKVTSVIAVVYALPPRFTVALAAAALAVTINLGLLLVVPYVSRSSRVNRSAITENAMITFLLRTVRISFLVFVVVTIAQLFKLAATTSL